jgi:hypothetical protein
VDLDFDEIFFAIPIPFTRGKALNRSIYNPNKYQIDMLLACDTDKYYKELFLKKAFQFSGKTPKTLDLISYEGVIYDRGLEDTISDFIGALLARASQSQLSFILNRMETASTNQYEAHFNAVLNAHRHWIEKLAAFQTKMKASTILSGEILTDLQTQVDHQAASLGVKLSPWPRLTQPNSFLDTILKDHAEELLRSNSEGRTDSRALKNYLTANLKGQVPKDFILATRALRRRLFEVQSLEFKALEQSAAEPVNAVRTSETPGPVLKSPTDLSSTLRDLIEFSEAMTHAHRSFYQELSILKTDGPNSQKQHFNMSGVFDETR